MEWTETTEGLTIDTGSETETDRLGRALASIVEAGTVIGLIGELGAGKTRLVRALGQGLGIDPTTVTSPTYVLIHEYEGVLPVFHFDAYRVGSPSAFEALGASEYWDAGGICLVEWADLVLPVLPPGCWVIRIESTGRTSRRFAINGINDPAIVARLKHAVLEV
ncbi:MAG: tRNA (adenosine(37)-N6)-threonylcarbamoyltransferase complex ATPase subunit type 1 TsaE [Isosphaeraceae bacterium]